MTDDASQPADKPPTKTQILNALAESTGMSKKQVTDLFDALSDQIQTAISGDDAPGQFTIPGLCKIVVRNRPAREPRLVRNPATGEMVMSKAKPASKAVAVRPLKALKDLVAEE